MRLKNHHCDLFIFAGESSGDLHGEKLLEALQCKRPDLKIAGVGGPKMRAFDMQCILPMEEFQVMGFIDVFLALPKLIRLFHFVRRQILALQPKAVLFIDYPGFNLRMAKALRKHRFEGKLCHYICPSVWAWGKKRIPQMADTLDLLLTILPFESSYFSHTALNVQYVGHPLVKRLQAFSYRDLPLPKKSKLIALFPGSRIKEIRRNLPLQLRTATRLMQLDPDLIFAISISEPHFEAPIKALVHNHKLELDRHVFLVGSENVYNLMRACDLALAKSGTVTLELALHRTPTVVMYAVTPLDQFIALNLLRIRLRHYCLVNIIGNSEIFPELIGSNLTHDTLYHAATKFLSDPAARQDCQRQCDELRNLLQTNDASEHAATALINSIF